MVHIGRPHTSLPYTGGGSPIALDPDLVDIGELEAMPSTILGVNENNEWTLNPINAGWWALLNSDNAEFIAGALGMVYAGDLMQAIDGLKMFVKKLTLSDGLDMSSTKITAMAPGTAATDAVNKSQLDGKQNASAKLSAMMTLVDAMSGSTQRIPSYIASSDTWAAISTTSTGRAIMAMADYAAFRIAAGLQIGVDVQAYNARLAAFGSATIGSTGNRMLFTSDGGTTWNEFITSILGRNIMGQSDAAAVNNLLPTALNPQTGTNRGPGLTDAQKLITMNNANPNTITIPATATVAFPEGTVLGGMQIGTGQTSFVAASGVTMRAPLGAKIARQYGTAAAVKIGTDEWVVYGDVTT